LRTLRLLLIGALLAILAAAAIGLVWIRRAGLDAHDAPSAFEARVARAVRGAAIPRAIRDRANPVTASPEVVAEAMGHYADHCASCHGNDGSGDTTMGKGLSPRVPDMRLPATQSLSDGELFWIIDNGVRFTGMPAWGNGTPASDDATWKLVHFIRHLPKLTAEELDQMSGMNPRSPEEIREEIEEQKFLEGEKK
jgi:mono/diheme cytochrome c family protein